MARSLVDGQDRRQQICGLRVIDAVVERKDLRRGYEYYMRMNQANFQYCKMGCVLAMSQELMYILHRQQPA